MYTKFKLPEDYHASLDKYGLTYIQRLSLFLQRGCQACGAPRIKKVHWPFPVRMCTQCFKNMTINDYHLKDDYNITKRELSGLDFLSKVEYVRAYAEKDVEGRIYVKKDVERHIGNTLAAYSAAKATRWFKCITVVYIF
jgi:hypothetical protein